MGNWGFISLKFVIFLVIKKEDNFLSRCHGSSLTVSIKQKFTIAAVVEHKPYVLCNKTDGKQ